MWPLLALLALGAVAGLGGGKSPSPKLAPLKAQPPAPGSPRAALAVLRVKQAPSTQSTLAQLLMAEEQALLGQTSLDEAIKVAQARTHTPDPQSDPDVFTEWANDYGLSAESFRILTPFFGWYPNTPVHVPMTSQEVQLHPETLWRAQYKFSDSSRGAVSWWINKDGTYAYDHVWGGFDLWKDISDLANEVVKAADDIEAAAKAAGQWLDDHLGNINWSAIADDIETAASFVPILGTAVSDIVATAQVIIEDLSDIPSLEKAVDTAYDYALASIPGGASLHGILDPIKNAIVAIALKGEKVGKVVIEDIANQAPDSPNIEGISPRSIVASLLTIVAHALGVST